jgi:SAM-dependent methyltransferase
VAREQRLVFGEDAELYDRARPWYPGALLDEVVALGGHAPRAVDAGTGTGRAAVMLAERGVVGVGVEPDPAMAAVARRNLAPHPGWTVTESGFEEFDGEAHAFDLVTAAQAWHWMDPTRRLDQAARLLRAGGWLALFWNKPVQEPTRLRRRLDVLYATHAPDVQLGPPGSQQHDRVGDRPDEAVWPTILTRTYAWTRSYTSGEYVDLLCTSSDHRLLPDDRRDALLGGIGDAIDRLGGGRYDLTYTVALWAARRA